MTIIPTQDYILVQPRKAADRSKGGIILPDAQSRPMADGEVLAVGPGRVLPDGAVAPVRVDVGAVVMFVQYSGAAVTREHDGPVLLREGDIMAVVR
jgi:chaperonin GroES